MLEWLICALLALPAARSEQQLPLSSPDGKGVTNRKLHGRFLHITDLHPDPHYKVGSAVSTSCHRNAPKKEEERAGYWGVPYSECDSPESLTNLTLEHWHSEWSNKVDFIIWTGDSARHDNDDALPRTPSEIFASNQKYVKRMIDAFPGVPIVPSLGNNDIWPHNIMTPGPNSITNEFSSIWRPFLPFSSYQVFQRGAYFSAEVIPDHVAVFSLNTLYWYDSNKAVEGCEYGNHEDPGNLEFDWLGVQLEMYRERGMQVWISGHVPPTPGNYFPECYYRYVEVALRFQDTILGHLFGHMNVDHFFWFEPSDLVIPGSSSTSPRQKRHRALSSLSSNSTTSSRSSPRRSRSRFMPNGKRALLHHPSSSLSLSNTDAQEDFFDGRTELDAELLEDFKSLPKNSKTDLDDFAIINVGASVIPAYLPSFRVWQYNVTGWDGTTKPKTRAERDAELGLEDDEWDDEDEWTEEDGDDEVEESWDEEANGNKKKKPKKPPPPPKKRKRGSKKRKHGHRHHDKPDCEKKQNQNRRDCLPLPPRHTDENSPSRKNTLWSPLGYAQYFLPDLGTANKSHPPKYQLEYLTYSLEALTPPPSSDNSSAITFEYPIPPHLLPKSLRHLNGTRTSSKYAPYSMKDLTIPEWINLARKMARKGKLFEKFRGYMYMGEEEDDDDKDKDKDKDGGGSGGDGKKKKKKMVDWEY